MLTPARSSAARHDLEANMAVYKEYLTAPPVQKPVDFRW
jgi:hypothetical protein